MRYYINFNHSKRKNMSRREVLENEVEKARERIDNASKDVPANIKKLWEKELVELEFELNNFDEYEDNNE